MKKRRKFLNLSDLSPKKRIWVHIWEKWKIEKIQKRQAGMIDKKQAKCYV